MRMIEAALLIGHLRRIQGGNAGCVGSISALNYERDMKNERRADREYRPQANRELYPLSKGRQRSEQNPLGL